MARGADSEAGGAADLQTDVMRFMAILSLCLMVIFAVVQSVPVETVQKARPTTTQQPQTEVQVETRIEAPPPVDIKRPAVETPKPSAPTEMQTELVPRPPQPPPQSAAKPEAPEGFTLSFETDLALTQLIARDEIGLYAITSGSAMRMTINQDKAEFWSASLPKQFHEMDTATVPESVIRALGISTNSSVASTKWGVTLPAVMSGNLKAYMRDHRGGSLVIGADGILRMEP